MLSTAELSVDQSTLPNTSSFNRKDDGCYKSESDKHCISFVLVTLIVLAALSFAIVWVVALVVLKKDRYEMLIAMQQAKLASTNENRTAETISHVVVKRAVYNTSALRGSRASRPKLKGA
ncbi:hypothetical protein Tcan_12415 [Toxocara canis]|uniref:Uncharacterized protein n=1 Tax=Toxocara canis TaxID=6265 RepID=A0A0B2VI47_TOXCA|nr:hypothetical protein Tcan_12415 [Toxocara canis]